MAQLHNPLGPRQIAQRVTAEIGQPRIGRELVDDQITGGARKYRLAAVTQVAQPCGAIDRRPDVVGVSAGLAA